MSQSEVSQLVDQAGFIFRGRVISRDADDSTDSNVPGHSVTVEVEEILLSAPVLSTFAGKQATMVAEETANEVGSEFIFFTRVLALSSELKIGELGRLSVSRGNVDQVAQAVHDAAERPLQKNLASAEMIIVAHVIASQKIDVPERRQSEHDPEWWIAEVRVEAVLKGTKDLQDLKVLFANSKDIAWYLSPKLHEGVRGILLLRRATDVEELPKRIRAAYAATHPLDLQPLESLIDIERMLTRGERRG